MELTTFVGRRRELDDVQRQLGEWRLVTLTGTGGVGKTRLAQRVADRARRAFAHGAWFVDFTAVNDPALLTHHRDDPDWLAHLVSLEVGLGQHSAQPSLELLTDHIGTRSVLLVLDNCEHLIPGCSVLAEQLLIACPALRIVATSREPLGIAGEHLFAVQPLPVPEAGIDASGYEAVALFQERGQTALPGFTLGQDNQDAVAAICRRLDGLPLAIELAASWLPVLAPQEILDRLADRFRLLARGARSAPTRQRTLRACMDWSFELCSKPERLLWARTSVFVGAASLDAIEGVCTDERLGEAELLEVLAGLVEKSVFIREENSQVTRYRMLEMLKDYGRNRLVETGEHDHLRRRHRDWFEHLVEQARAEWLSDQQVSWYRRLGSAHSELRAAMEFSLTEPGEVESALQMAVDLPTMFWLGRGVFSEGRRWLERGLAKAPAPTPLRARALVRASELAFIQGSARSGTRLLEEGTQLASALDASATLAAATWTRGVGAIYAGDLPAAVEVLEEGLKAIPSIRDTELELRLKLLSSLGRAAGLAGDHDRAIACANEVLGLTGVGQPWWRSHAMRILGHAAWRRGELHEARRHVGHCIRLSQEVDDHYGTALGLEEMAWITSDQGDHSRAATLLGCADVLFADLAAPMASRKYLLGFHRRCEQDARATLGDAAYFEAFAKGRDLTYQQALDFTLERTHRAPPVLTPATPLTRREQEVAGLVAEGLSNKEIAARLVISPRTAESHVQNVLVKLGFTSRTQVAVWVASKDGAENGG